MWLFILLVVPVLSVGINIHYLVNDPEGFFKGLVKSFAVFGIAIGVIILLAITGHID